MTAEQESMWMAVAIECAAVEKIGVLKLIEKLKERFIISERAALSPAKQEQPDFEALAKVYAENIKKYMTEYVREFSADQVVFYAKKDYLAGLRVGYLAAQIGNVAALPYTEEK